MLGLVSGYLERRRQAQESLKNSFQPLNFSENDEAINTSSHYFDVLPLHVHPRSDQELFLLATDDEDIHFETIVCNETGDSYEGPVTKNGIKHGDGAIFRKLDGTKFIGAYKNNLPYEGTIVAPEKFTYTGKLDQEGKFHGPWGVLVETSGIVYTGEFYHGFFDGVGKEMVERVSVDKGSNIKTCTVYTGNFRRGLRHGLGTMIVRSFQLDSNNKKIANDNSDDSSIVYLYSGMWCEGLKEGEAIEINALNSEKFEGHFFRNKRHGMGVLTLSRSGTSKRGTWRAGIPVDGPGWTITYQDGAEYCGETRYGQAHGRGTIRYAEPLRKSKMLSEAFNVYTGEFRNGARHGKGICVYASGEEFDGLWVEDEPVVPDDTRNTPSQHVGSIPTVIGDTSKSMKTIPVVDDEKKYYKLNTLEDHAVGEATKAEKVDDLSLVFNISIPKSATKFSYPNGDLFFGTLDENGVRQGHGIYIGGKSGCSRYEGEFVNGKRHGPNGILITAFTKYIGDFANDLKNGQGTLIHNDTSSYKGSFRHGMFHGLGVFCDADYRVYTGEFESGVEHGAGEEWFSDGSVFRGEFKEGKRNGVGSFVNKNGEFEYSGEWIDGLMEGEGVLYYKTPLSSSIDIQQNEEYRGMFVRGMKSGNGKLTTADGHSFKGKWIRDIPVDGEWTVRYPDGSAFSGFATCRVVGADPSRPLPIPNGFGTRRYKNGDVYSGNLIDGKREGRGVQIFSNGDCWDGTWARDAVDIDGAGILTLADGTEHKFGSIIDGLISFE